MYCRNCGKELPENSKFCNNCGAQQEVEEQTVHSTNKDEEKINAKKALILNYSKIFFIIAPFISFASLFCTIVTTSNFIRVVAITVLIISAILWCVSCYLIRKMLKQTIGKKPNIKWFLNNLWSALAGIFVVGCLLLSFTTGDSAKPTNETADTSVVSSTVVTTAEPTTETAIEISAIKLINEYQNNEIAFEKNYVGKTLSVSGTITDISLSSGSAYISLSDGESWFNVDCRLLLSEEEKAAELNSGEYITIKGKCTGESWGDPRLTGCIIVE